MAAAGQHRQEKFQQCRSFEPEFFGCSSASIHPHAPAAWRPAFSQFAAAECGGQTGVEHMLVAEVVLGQRMGLGQMRVKQVEVLGGVEIVGMKVVGRQAQVVAVGQVKVEKPRQVATMVGEAARPRQSSSRTRG